MIELQERFVVDDKGKRVAVILDIKEYNRLLEWIEDQEDARAVNEAQASGEKGIPLEEAITQIEREAQLNCENRHVA